MAGARRLRRCRAAARPACAMAATAAVQPVDFVPHARGAAAAAAPKPRRQPSQRARCASAAASATGFTGRCAPPALRRRSRRNISRRWRPRSTSATSRPSDSFDLVLGRHGANLLYAGLSRAGERELQLVKWNANGRSEWIDAANADQPAAVSSGMTWPVERPHHLLFRLSLSPDPALHALPRGLDIGASLGQPDRRRSGRPGRRRRLGGRLWPRGPIAHGGGISTSTAT